MVKKVALELVTILLVCCALLLVKSLAPPAPVESTAVEAPFQTEKLADDADDTRIDINLATAEELKSLPGIGQVIAERIVADRLENGYYIAPVQILRVKGIGLKKYDKMARYITLNRNDLIIYLGY